MVKQCTQVRFASFLSGGFITATIVVNPPESKLAKHTSVQCSALHIFLLCTLPYTSNPMGQYRDVRTVPPPSPLDPV